MRRLLPVAAGEVALAEAYAVPDTAGRSRPFVRCNMISTLDGAIAVQGRSGMLGGPADRRVFQVLRAQADVVVVGAGTARAEGYGPARLDPELRRGRTAGGKSPVPPIAVVTGSGDLDWGSPFFAQAEERPIVFSTARGLSSAGAPAAEVAELVEAGEERVDPGRVLAHLQGQGRGSVLLEGGPGLNADFVAAGLLDELCLTLAPRLVAGSGPRVLAGPELPRPLDLDVVGLLEEDGFLFYRLAVPPPAGGGA
ncbi:MAG: pyrimidine reductase family protein [Acidobacteriota bacterium]|nr:pyrimidine reductase family protein [Acidobacteriota bacterium]